nr:uncharacterized LOC128092246 homolog isoform X1 [Dasypus novemcinctus]
MDPSASPSRDRPRLPFPSGPLRPPRRGAALTAGAGHRLRSRRQTGTSLSDGLSSLALTGFDSHELLRRICDFSIRNLISAGECTNRGKRRIFENMYLGDCHVLNTLCWCCHRKIWLHSGEACFRCRAEPPRP